jgi:hypothetical protein
VVVAPEEVIIPIILELTDRAVAQAEEMLLKLAAQTKGEEPVALLTEILAGPVVLE